LLATVPAKVKISRSPHKSSGSPAPASRSRAPLRLPTADITKPAQHDRAATSASRAARKSAPGESRKGSGSMACRLTYQVSGAPCRRSPSRSRVPARPLDRRVRRHGDELVGVIEAKAKACCEWRESGECMDDLSLNHLICALQQRWRNGDAQRLCGLQVDHKLKLGWLLHRNIGGLRALEKLVDEAGCAAPMPRVG